MTVCVLATGLASTAFAGVTHTISAYGNGGSLVTPAAWSIVFTFDGSLLESSTATEFGNWTFTLTSGGQTFLASDNDVLSGSFTRKSATERLYTVELFDSEASAATSDFAATPVSNVTISFTAVKSGSVWSLLGAALQHSSNDATRGTFSVTSSGGGSSGTLTTAYMIPSPGSAALVGLASLLVRRRRH